jgi:hypothetical protein
MRFKCISIHSWWILFWLLLPISEVFFSDVKGHVEWTLPALKSDDVSLLERVGRGLYMSYKATGEDKKGKWFW